MSKEEWKPRKVVIVGAGAVGSTFAWGKSGTYYPTEPKA